MPPRLAENEFAARLFQFSVRLSRRIRGREYEHLQTRHAEPLPYPNRFSNLATRLGENLACLIRRASPKTESEARPGRSLGTTATAFD